MEMKIKLPWDCFKSLELKFSESGGIESSKGLHLFHYGNGVVSITIYADNEKEQLGKILSEMIKLNPEMEIKGISRTISSEYSLDMIAIFGQK